MKFRLLPVWTSNVIKNNIITKLTLYNITYLFFNLIYFYFKARKVNAGKDFRKENRIETLLINFTMSYIL